MNNNFRASNDSSILAERLFNALSQYMDAVDLAEFIAQNPDMTIQGLANKLAELRDKANSLKSNPLGLPSPSRRWVTDRLVETRKGTYKDYREA